jgi:hypothetical protein
MNRDTQNSNKAGGAAGNGAGNGAATVRGGAEETLRLIARLAAPAGLEGRVHHKLRTAPREARVLAWPMPAGTGREWMRAAAAAAIAFAIAGGGWSVYSRVQPRPAGGFTLAPHAAPGGFAGAGAVRTPQTLNGPVVDGPAPTSPAPMSPVSTGPVTPHPAEAKSTTASLPAKGAKKIAAHNAATGQAGVVAPQAAPQAK